MKRKILAFLIAAILVISSTGLNPADAGVSVHIFLAPLAPYGAWVNVAGYGLAWRPVGLSGDWLPYEYGHWESTEYGWTWISDEPWGGIVYHYGNWVYDQAAGWVWIPGTTWAPAWVSWYSGPDYTGWAPVGYGVHAAFVPRRIMFVRSRDFLAAHLDHFALAGDRRDAAFRSVRMLNGKTNVRGAVFRTGPSVASVERNTGMMVRRTSVRDPRISSATNFGRPTAIQRTTASYRATPYGSRTGNSIGSRNGSRPASRVGNSSNSRFGGSSNSRNGNKSNSRFGSSSSSRFGGSSNSRNGNTSNSRFGSSSSSRFGGSSNSRNGNSSNSRFGSSSSSRFGGSSGSRFGSSSSPHYGNSPNVRYGNSSSQGQGYRPQATQVNRQPVRQSSGSSQKKKN